VFVAALLPVALAAEPPAITPVKTTDGAWAAEVLIPSPVTVVRAALEDPIKASRFSPDTTDIHYVTRGTCDVLHVQTGVRMWPVDYDMQRCATADGWHETLVGSGGLSDYDVRWALQPAGDSTRVQYKVRIGLSFLAPEFLLNAQLKSSISEILGRLYRATTL
jgi:hypothetical protein